MQFVIIGNGIAGISAAHAIRGVSPEADVTIISEEPHPGYSACLLPYYVSGRINRNKVFIKPLPHYRRDGIRLIPERRAHSFDIQTREILAGDERIPYDRLIIATGSKAGVPPVKGLDKKGVFTFKSLEDADRIYDWKGLTAVVVGSGAVGVEAAIALKSSGYRVLLLELFDWILPRSFDDHPADMIKHILEAGGIEVLTGEKLVGVLGDKRVEGVSTDEREIPCDTVVLGTGMRPEIEISKSGIALGQLGGLQVDDRMKTSVPGVYACGDCVEATGLVERHPVLSMLWHNARQQGTVAGCNAAGLQRSFPGSLSMSTIDVFGIQAVSLGQCSVNVTGDLEVVERKKNQGYQRSIFSKGVLVGAQFINWGGNMGSWVAAILRGATTRDAEDIGKWKWRSSRL